MSEKSGFNRRQFLAGTAAASAFTIIPRHVLGAPGQPSANEKLNIAGVGVGGMGSHDIQQVPTENIVAICDVDAAQAARAAKPFPARENLQRLSRDARCAEGHRRGDGRHARSQPCRGHHDGAEDGQARLLPEAAYAQRPRGIGDCQGGERSQRSHSDGQPGPGGRRGSLDLRVHLVRRHGPGA